MKVSLIVLSAGKAAGRILPINVGQFVIGRDPQCNLRPASAMVSNRHCAVLVSHRGVFLRDFNSTNGTFVNEQPVKGEVAVKDGDVVKIGPLTFKLVIEGKPLRTTPAADDVLDALLDSRESITVVTGVEFDSWNRDGGGATVVDVPVFDSGPARVQAEKEKVAQLSFLGRSPEEEIKHIRNALTHNHLHCLHPEVIALYDILSTPTSLGFGILQAGFHRLLVLDAQRGQDMQMAFHLDNFLRYVFLEMGRAFDLHLEADAYHPEKIAQILKDEKHSLFCFINVHLLTESTLSKLRHFSQENHRVFYCGVNDYIASRSFPLGPSPSQEKPASGASQDAARALLEKLRQGRKA